MNRTNSKHDPRRLHILKVIGNNGWMRIKRLHSRIDFFSFIWIVQWVNAMFMYIKYSITEIWNFCSSTSHHWNDLIFQINSTEFLKVTETYPSNLIKPGKFILNWFHQSCIMWELYICTYVLLTQSNQRCYCIIAIDMR